MKSSPKNKYFICTDWHYISKKCQYSFYLECLSILRNRKQTWYRLQEREHPQPPRECAEKCTEDVRQVSVQFFASLAEIRSEKPD